MSTVMVTGVNGFVGHHLVDALLAGHHDVIGVGREPAASHPSLSSYVPCDLTNPDQVAQLPLGDVTAIINLAGLAQVGSSFGKEDLYEKVNVGVLSVLGEELLRQKLNPRLIAISTGAVYDSSQPMPLTETSKTIVDGSPYAKSKLLMEQTGKSLRAKSLNVTIVRPFNHIGPGQAPGFLVPDMYQKIQLALTTGQPLSTGDLTTRRDYTDVRDVVRAYAMLANTPLELSFDVYNVCSGVSHSGEDILSIFQKIVPGATKLNLTVDPTLLRPNDPKELIGSNQRLTSALDWQPTISLEKSIQDFVSSQTN